VDTNTEYFRGNFGKYGKNHLFLLLYLSTPQALSCDNKSLYLVKTILDIVEGFWIQSDNFHLKHVSPHLVLFAKNSLHGILDIVGVFTRGYVKEELMRNKTANSSICFICMIQILGFFYG
jgi:hypothetical protein